MTVRQLAPQFDPAAIETSVYQRWLDAGVFSPDPAAPGDPYVIVIPPPNVTDRLHMGHGLNNAIQDTLIRFERMRGRQTLWLPGTDHAGIATQNVVERLVAREGQTRQSIGREQFVERVWTYVHETGGTILEQLKAIGASCDWSRTRFTLDAAYSAAVRHVFVRLHEEGLIYRGYRVIHWCPRCHTSLSDEEAEFEDVDGKLYFLRYGLVPLGEREDVRTGETAQPLNDPGIVVATTRPETMFGDVALAVHPEDGRYTGLIGATVDVPLSGTRIPVRGHPRVEREFGTGTLKITPAHDPNDFEIAADLDPGGDRPTILTEDARMADVERVPADLRGLDRFEARKRIVQALERNGQLLKIEPHRHAVRHCYRCHTVVEPRLSDQWFVKMAPLARPALEAYRAGRLTFVPERWGTVYENWLVGIRDWNISRQLWWGHRIPAWYCEQAGAEHITVSETTPAACARCGAPVRQDDDVLDTWFSSWLWPFATFGWPGHTPDLERFYPGHALVTGPDIIFFWVARMVMAGYHFLGERPFATVFLNGIVRDAQHQKMSKSRGNGIDPLEVVRGYGADALRYAVLAGSAVGTDVILDPQDLETSFAPGRNFANKLWNVGRFILSNLEDAPAHPRDLDPCRLELADRWILSRCQRVIADTTEALERFRLNDAIGGGYRFVWDELADWYVEQVKPRLYGTARGGAEARAVLVYAYETALRLLHPAMPFVTETLWSHLPGEREPLLAAARWPTPIPALIDPEAERRFAAVQNLVTAVRTIRSEYGVAPGQTVRAVVQPASLDTAEAVNAEQRTIERLAKVASLAMTADPGGQATAARDHVLKAESGRYEITGSDADLRVGAHAVLADGSSVFVPLGDAIDVARECARLREELNRVDQQIAGVAKTLGNENFLRRAPAEVVERERVKEATWREQRVALAGKLHVLGC